MHCPVAINYTDKTYQYYLYMQLREREAESDVVKVLFKFRRETINMGCKKCIMSLNLRVRFIFWICFQSVLSNCVNCYHLSVKLIKVILVETGEILFFNYVVAWEEEVL